MGSTEFFSSREAANAALATLERYRRDVRRLAGSWLDSELYRAVGAQLDHLRHCCQLLPEVSLPWVEVMISHAELVHCLWRTTRPDPALTADERHRRLQEHLVRIDSLMQACLDAAGAAGADGDRR